MSLLPFSMVALLLMTSCAIRNDYATIQAPPTLKASSPRVLISLEVDDLRESKDVGYLKNFLGMKTARILPKDPIATTLYDSIAKSLASHGIGIGQGPLHLYIKVKTCYSDYKTALIITRSIATVVIEARLTSAQGNLLYEDTLQGSGTQSPVFAYSGKNTGAAISKALVQLLQNLCDEIIPLVASRKETSS